jgi:hypothetical protein
MKHQELKPLNVHFVTSDDPEYLCYTEKYKNPNRQSNTVRRADIRAITDIMGDLLERSVKHWISKASKHSAKNIIKYSVPRKKKTIKLFKEVDYVLELEDTLVLGEIKSTICEDGNIKDVLRQFNLSKELLEPSGMNLQFSFIWVDLLEDSKNDCFDSFSEDFDQVRFRQNERDGLPFQCLRLKAEDVFLYGVKEGVIKSPELFPELEIQMSIQRGLKTLKKVHSRNKVLASDNEKEESEIALHMAMTQLELSKKGYVILESESLKNNFIKLIGHVSDLTVFSEAFISFSGSQHHVCVAGEQRLELISSNQVYLMIRDEFRAQAEEIYFADSPLLNGTANTMHPLINRHPTRKFFYSGVLSQKSDASKEACITFKEVLANSKGIRVHLQPGQFLIFDNHRLLHKLVSNS